LNIAAELVLVYLPRWSDRYIENIIVAGLSALRKRGRQDVIDDILDSHKQLPELNLICPDTDCTEVDCPHYEAHEPVDGCDDETSPGPHEQVVCPMCVPVNDYILGIRGLV
jgi:hypothetical protein